MNLIKRKVKSFNKKFIALLLNNYEVPRIPPGGINVPAPSGFNPMSLGNLSLWLDANYGVTLNGSNVSQWDDRSGNGNNFIQASASNQPLFVSNGINTSLPIITFDGVNDVMSLAIGLTVSNITFYIVYKRNVDSQQFVIAFNASIYPYIQKPGEFQMGNNAFGTGGMITGDWYITNGVGNSDGSLVKGYSNNTQIGSTISGSSFNYLTMQSLGSSDFGLIDGSIAELLVFDEVHDDTKRNQMHEYLNDKYSIY